MGRSAFVRVAWSAAVIAASAVAVVTPASRADDGTLIEVIDVFANYGGGVFTNSTFEAGVEYLLVASGSYTLGPDITGDAECTAASPSFTFEPTRYGTGTGDLGDLFADYREMPWRPAVSGDVAGCGRTRVYTARFRPRAYGRQNLLILDTISWDNSGSLRVAIYRAPAQCSSLEGLDGCEPPTASADDPSVPRTPDQPLPPTPPLPVLPPSPVPPWAAQPPPPPVCCGPDADTPTGRPLVSGHTVEAMILDPRTEGVTSRQVYQAGRTYQLVVQGTQAYAGWTGPMADAECSQGPGDSGWKPDRFGPSDLDVLVNGQPVTWQPIDFTGQCDELTHTYLLSITPTSSGTITFSTSDQVRGDAFGLFTITAVTFPQFWVVDSPVPHIPGNLVGSVYVDSRQGLGTWSTMALRPGKRYTLVTSGTYYWVNGVADAECSFGTSDLRTLRHRWGTDELDLTVNGAFVDWQPAGRPDPQGCDATNTYWTTIVAPASPSQVLLAIVDNLWPARSENYGGLTVSIYES